MSTEDSATQPQVELPQTQTQPQDSESSQAQAQVQTPQEDGHVPTTETAIDQQQGQEQNSEQPDGPEIVPALASEGGREVSNKILYVGGLTKAITEEQIREIFSVSGEVQSVKILFDKNRPGFNYAFVEFEEDACAADGYESFNGKIINGSEFRINWAYQSQQAKSNPEAFNVFVGDLSAEINDDKLKNAFANFPSLLQAHVMWDMQSGRSRGYGFVSFEERGDADEAIRTMNGEVISGRAIRLNWASHKQTHGHNHSHHHGNHHHHNGNGMGNQNGNGGYHYNKYNNNGNNHHHYQNGNGNSNHHHNSNSNYSNGNGYQQNSMLPNGANGSPGASSTSLGNNGMSMSNGAGPMNGGMMSPPNYEAVLRKSPNWQTTVYLGNLAHFTTQNDLIPLLQNFGFIVDLKFHPDKGCAFVKYDSHERAALAIVQLTGLIVNGRALKLGWGRERQPTSVPYQNFPMVYGQ